MRRLGLTALGFVLHVTALLGAAGVSRAHGHPGGPPDTYLATGRVIARFRGARRFDFRVPSLTGLGDRHFATVEDLEQEVTNARTWGGIHYRAAIDDGVVVSANRTVAQVLSRHFRRSKR